MKQPDRIKNRFSWVPMDKRLDRLGQPLPPRKPEKRIPKYWLIRDEKNLYFVNNTDESIESVSSSPQGFEVEDGEIYIIKRKGYVYDNVEPQEAVKLAEFDPFADYGSVLQVDIRVQLKKDVCVKMLSPSHEGGMTGDAVLQWDTGEAGKDVSISNC